MGVRWHKKVEKVKKVNNSTVDLDKVKEIENLENNVWTPVEDLDVDHYWSEFKKAFGVENSVETLPQLRGVEVEDLDEPKELKFQRLLKPKPIAEFTSSKKISKLFEVACFTASLYVLIVSAISISVKTLKKEIIKLLEPVESLIREICSVSLEQLKKLIRVDVQEQVLTVDEVLPCLVCRELNKVQLEKIFKSGSTIKVKVIEVTIRGNFGDFVLDSEQVVDVLKLLEKFSISSELKFEKCKFCK